MSDEDEDFSGFSIQRRSLRAVKMVKGSELNMNAAPWFIRLISRHPQRRILVDLVKEAAEGEQTVNVRYKIAEISLSFYNRER